MAYGLWLMVQYLRFSAKGLKYHCYGSGQRRPPFAEDYAGVARVRRRGRRRHTADSEDAAATPPTVGTLSPHRRQRGRHRHTAPPHLHSEHSFDRDEIVEKSIFFDFWCEIAIVNKHASQRFATRNP